MKHIGTFCKLLKQVIQWSIQYPRYLLGKFSQHAVQVFKAYNSAKFWFSYNNHVRQLFLFLLIASRARECLLHFFLLGLAFGQTLLAGKCQQDVSEAETWLDNERCTQNEHFGRTKGTEGEKQSCKRMVTGWDQCSWVRIPVRYTGWTFFEFICCKKCNVCLKKTKIYEKRPLWWSFFTNEGRYTYLYIAYSKS